MYVCQAQREVDSNKSSQWFPNACIITHSEALRGMNSFNAAFLAATERVYQGLYSSTGARGRLKRESGKGNFNKKGIALVGVSSLPGADRRFRMSLQIFILLMKCLRFLVECI